MKILIPITFIFFILYNEYSNGQNSVSIGAEIINKNAVLQLVSPNNNQGFLAPRVTTAQRMSMALTSEDNGMLVFDNTTNEFYYWHSGKWYPMSTTTGTNEMVITAGTNITISGDGTAENPYVINAPSHYVGESYGGGIVFYAYDNGQHGLIAATADQSAEMRWNAGTSANTMALADGVGAGKANTAIIIASQGYGDGGKYAARVCNEFSVTVDGVKYSDWYLPSIFELNLLYLQRNVVGGFSNAAYWSSTEGNIDYAWRQYFSDGNQGSDDKGYPGSVRVIRAF
jgi:hypothetical protein